MPSPESDRRAQVEQALNEILDPCSVACGAPIGLVDMGIVDAVEISRDAVEVRLLPTFPGCIYTAVFAGEILQRLGALDWTAEISVELAEGECVWDETRMSSDARERLRRLRQERIRRGLVAVRGR